MVSVDYLKETDAKGYDGGIIPGQWCPLADEMTDRPLGTKGKTE
jgi:hypothetical protein